MNFIPSLLLYNPLEAMEILLLVGIFSKYKYDKFELLFHSFLYGAINLIFQYSASILMGTFSYAVITCLNNFVISSLTLFLYCKYIINIKMDIKFISLISISFYMFNLILVILLNAIGLFDLFVINRELLNEFMVNMIIRLPQLFIVGNMCYRKRLRLCSKKL